MDYVKESNIPFLMKMFDENFGEHYMSEDEMRWHINDENEFFYAARREDGRLAGIALFGVETEQTLHEETKIPREELKRLAHGKQLVKFRSMCMASDCQGQGIGSKLLADAIADLKSRGKFGAVTSLIWVYDGKAPARGAHLKNGFRYLHRVSRPWYHMKDYYCVFCKGRCKCDGEQYVLELEDEHMGDVPDGGAG